MARRDRRHGRYAYEGLERVMHEKARLGILTSLAAHPEGLLFSELKELCALTDGNLARHLQVREEALLVESWKRERRTLCRLSVDGRARFLEYVSELERVVSDAARLRGAEGDAAAGYSPA
jgi:DNA-binding transcriptional ArsR family regulator